MKQGWAGEARVRAELLLAEQVLDWLEPLAAEAQLGERQVFSRVALQTLEVLAEPREPPLPLCRDSLVRRFVQPESWMFAEP